MIGDTATLAARYLELWRDRNFDELRRLLADDATFEGPLGHADNADECVDGLRRMSEIMTDVVIQKTFIDGDDAITWFDLHTAKTEPLPVVNWRHMKNGKIATIRVTFDPRPLFETSDR